MAVGSIWDRRAWWDGVGQKDSLRGKEVVGNVTIGGGLRILAAGWVVAGCASGAAPRRPQPPGPAGGGRGAEYAFPPVPAVDGPLRLDLVYPPENAALTAPDSTFVFGSVGTGRATLTIDGVTVPVAPDGAFLAYLPIPPDGIYRLTAARDDRMVRLERTVQLPAGPPALPSDSARIVANSSLPSGALAVFPGQLVTVGFTGTAGGQGSLVLPTGARYPLVERPRSAVDVAARNFQREAGGGATGTAPAATAADYVGVVPFDFVLARRSVTPPMVSQAVEVRFPRPQPGGRADSVVFLSLAPGDTRAPLPAALPAESTVAAAARLAGPWFELVLGGDTARAPLAADVALLDPLRPLIGMAYPSGNSAPPRDWAIRGRPGTSGPYHYFWPAGTRLRIVEERAGFYRVQLAGNLSAWVPATDVRLLPTGTPPPGGKIAGVRFFPYTQFIDLRIPVPERLPFQVVEGDRSLQVDVFGGISDTNFFQYGALDPLIDRAGWSQPADSIYRVTVQLTAPVWGYRTFFDEAGDLVLRIRRPPLIDSAHPLRNLLVAVDAGHPPGGAIGPTRLTEAVANLAIARRLQTLLEAAGARVLMTRTDSNAVALGDRPQMATDSDAAVLVSIHNNAFPDGVNPFVNNGTSAYYFQPQSQDLARLLEQSLVAALGLRDLGIGRADLALVRPTWMPAALTETAFLMMPRQEAALRDPGVQERIARAHLQALELFLRERAAQNGSAR